MKHTEEPDAEKDTCPVLRGTGRQLVKLGAPRLLDHAPEGITSNESIAAARCAIGTNALRVNKLHGSTQQWSCQKACVELHC